MPKNLWGDLSELQVVPGPRGILQEQAQALTEATNGVLVGRVSATASGNYFRTGAEAISDGLSGSVNEINNFNSFGFNLDVKIPTLNNYVYTVLSITHPLELYPVRVLASKPRVDVSCENEQDFVVALQSILRSEELRNVLARLRSLAA